MPNISSLLSPGERGMMGGCVLGVIWRGARRSQTETQRNPADIPRRLPHHAGPGCSYSVFEHPFIFLVMILKKAE